MPVIDLPSWCPSIPDIVIHVCPTHTLDSDVLVHVMTPDQYTMWGAWLTVPGQKTREDPSSEEWSMWSDEESDGEEEALVYYTGPLPEATKTTGSDWKAMSDEEVKSQFRIDEDEEELPELEWK